MKAVLLHLGSNTGYKKDYVSNYKKTKYDYIYHDPFFCDMNVWRKVTEFAAKEGMDTVFVDMAEAVKLDKHPEIAVKGSLTKDEFRKELDRMRALGLTPLPKYNFSCCHNAWMQEHAYTVGTEEYYKFCEDIIDETCELFGNPEFFHLGLEEEDHALQIHNSISIVRAPEILTRDALRLFKRVKMHGARPVIWVDEGTLKSYGGDENFRKNIPTDTLLAPWYYERIRDNDNPDEWNEAAKIYYKLGEWGYEQLCTCSTWSWHLSAYDTMTFCKKHVKPESVKGFMMASWLLTCEYEYYGHLTSIENFMNAYNEIYGGKE